MTNANVLTAFSLAVYCSLSFDASGGNPKNYFLSPPPPPLFPCSSPLFFPFFALPFFFFPPLPSSPPPFFFPSLPLFFSPFFFSSSLPSFFPFFFFLSPLPFFFSFFFLSVKCRCRVVFILSSIPFYFCLLFRVVVRGPCFCQRPSPLFLTPMDSTPPPYPAAHYVSPSVIFPRLADGGHGVCRTFDDEP